MTSVSEEFKTATDFAIRDEDIERSRQQVGVDVARTHQEHFTEVSFDVIRNFARSYGDDNPLYVDDSYAMQSWWGGPVAPPMIGVAVNKPLRCDPPDPTLRRASFRGVHVFVSGSSWEFYRPVRPGDTIFSFGGVDSVEEKSSEFAGRSVQITNRLVRMNQRAEVISVSRTLSIFTERKTAREKGKYAAIEPASYSEADLERLDATYANEGPSGAVTRYWEDVAVGDPLTPLAKGPLTLTDIIVFHSGGYGFVPYAPSASRIAYKNRQRIPGFYIKDANGIPDTAQRVHWDAAWAQAIGNPMPYDYGVMRDCWLSHLLTDWMGDQGWLLRQSSQIRKFNYLGDSHVITGEVTRKYEENGLFLVDVAMRGTNQNDVETCPGSATIALPSRSGCAVVPPSPPADLEQRARAIMSRHSQLGG